MRDSDIIRAAALLEAAADALAVLQGSRAQPRRNMYHEFISPTAESLRTEAARLSKLASRG